LKKIEEKITFVLAIVFKFLLKSMLTLKKRKTAEILIFMGRSGQLQTGKLDFSTVQNYLNIIENKINE